MEPNAAPNSHAAPRLLFSLLGLAVGLCIATYAPPVYAQDSVDPTGCADDAVVHDDGDDMNGSDEDSVAVGCGAAVQQSEDTSATDTMKQPLFTLDAGNDGDVDEYLVQVNCDDSDVGVCAGRMGNQLVEISKTLHDRLQTVGDDVMEADGARTAGPLTEDEMADLTAALMDGDNVRPLADVAVGLNRLTATGDDIMRAESMSTNEVMGGVAVGSGAMVKADGGIAIGDGANVGSDMTTTVELTMDGMGVLVVGYEESESGGGGDNGIAIGNGASAMGEGSIAIGNGAMAMEDGQVMIGGHDIGMMADDVAANMAGVAANKTGMEANAAGVAANAADIATAERRLNAHDAQLANHDARLMAHGETLEDHNERLIDHGQKISENRGMINNNTSMIGNNASRINENRGMINTNSGKIDNNAERIDENRGMINSNTSMIGNNAGRINENRGMINANMQMLGTHATMIGNNKTRLDNHATVLMNHDGRLMAHAATLAEHDGRLDAHDQVLAGHAAGINNNAMEIQMLDERVSQVAAASAALSAVPNAPDMDEQFFVGVGVGSHGGESSVAAGVSGRLGANKNIVVNAGIANSGSGTSVRAGVGWSF